MVKVKYDLFLSSKEIDNNIVLDIFNNIDDNSALLIWNDYCEEECGGEGMVFGLDCDSLEGLTEGMTTWDILELFSDVNLEQDKYVRYDKHTHKYIGKRKPQALMELSCALIWLMDKGFTLTVGVV